MCDLYIQDSDPYGGWESDSASENPHYIPLRPQYVTLHECSDCVCSDCDEYCDYGVEGVDCSTCDHSAVDIQLVTTPDTCNVCHHVVYDDAPQLLQFEGEAAFTTEKPGVPGFRASRPSRQERRFVDKPGRTPKAITIERGDQTIQIEVPANASIRSMPKASNMQTQTPAPRKSVSAASKRNRAYMFCGRALAGPQSTSYRNVVLPRPAGGGDVEVIAKRATNRRASSHEPPIKPPPRASRIRLAIEAPRRAYW
ncbi:coenzyme F390 synthetase, putative [Babesia ovata]|uniref:Coenzyme F390 synthetase, putative n=1 Tax=Babesia ovata TaxID=189622 RepID=A0A2H6K834_9APIC|nr:coenzyme F390 synthetase, putative [Babesia ovata]GBE59156.1 coenzyme F390 synthetase, putative [Babesia ovata]